MIMEKINIVELLKDCPTGIELDCTIYDECILDSILEGETYPIKIRTPEGAMHLTKYGSMSYSEHAKCVIFPKGKTTWEGFQRPFKDGDIVATQNGIWIGITTGGESGRLIPTYCVIRGDDEFEAYLDRKEKWRFNRIATEEEKQKLFQAIKDNGYTWNPETKTLKKLIEPKFKVGDRIVDVLRKHMRGSGTQGVISKITDDKYIFTDGSYMPIGSQDNWELAPNKFDISTLVPFESRVLVRTKLFHDKWIAGFFSHKDSYEFAPFWTTADKNYQQCIPYEGNEHLLGKTDDCDDYYKTWE